MDEIYLLPAGNPEAVEHYEDTIVMGVKVETLTKYLDSNEMKSLQGIPEVFIWGFEPGKNNIPLWKRLGEGDIFIFVPTNGELVITRYISKIINRDLAIMLWNKSKKSGETWEYIFFMIPLGTAILPKRTLLTELGFSEKDYLMGSRRVTERFLEKFHNIENFINAYGKPCTSPEEYRLSASQRLLDNTLKRISPEDKIRMLRDALMKKDNDVEYVEVSGKRIKRDQALVKLVKLKAGYRCQACGFTFMKRDGEFYVEAIHIKPLSESKLDNETNMAALCPNCHKILDKGADEVRKKVLEKLKNNFQLD